MPHFGLESSAPNVSVMAHRSRASRSERIVSGQDLPEVVPWQDQPQRRPTERASHVIPQVVTVDTTPVGEKLESRFSRFSLASTTFTPPSPAAPSRKSSFKPNKKKHWIVLVAIIVIIAAAIAIAAGVAVTLTQKTHKNVNPEKSGNGANPAPDASGPAQTTVVTATAAATGQPSVSSSASSPTSTAQTCPNYVGPGISEVPQSLSGQVSSPPPNTVHVNVQFASKLPYTLVAQDQGQQQQIQTLVPQAFAFALSIDANQIQMGSTIPNDTAAELCYIQTVAQVYAPQQFRTTLEQYAFNWSSPLFHSPQQDVYTLMSRVYNMTFPA